MPMTDAKVALANEKKAARETAKAAREAAKPPRTPREVKLGAFAQIRPATTLGSLAMVLVNGPKSTDDLAAEISSTAEKVVSTLKRARVTHGIDHRIEDGVVTLVLPVGISAENLFKTPKEKPASNGDRAPVAKIADAATIAVLAEKNPKREGTKAYSAFSLYRDGMTCAEFIAAGGSKADLSWDRSHGFISISEAA